jgi:hypothetical protein
MKILHPSQRYRAANRLTAFAVCLLASAIQAHPGHYHPDETDEFDFLRATFFHSHGSLDYVLTAVVVGSVAVAWFSGRPAIRISALGMAAGSLAMLPIF